MTVHSRSRARAVSAFVIIVAAIGASFVACDHSQRSNGDECLKDSDCLSNVCSSRLCIAAPPILDGVPADGADVHVPDGGGDSSDAASPGPDASDDAEGPGPGDAAGDTRSESDASSGADARLDAAAFGRRREGGVHPATRDASSATSTACA